MQRKLLGIMIVDFDATNQLLVYAYDVNILCGGAYTYYYEKQKL
jgi:hypothetical protein